MHKVIFIPMVCKLLVYLGACGVQVDCDYSYLRVGHPRCNIVYSGLTPGMIVNSG